MARGRGRGRGGRGRRGGRGGGSRGRKSKGKGKGDNNEVLRFANELTVDDVLSNDVTALANTHWASGTEAAPADFDADLIDTIYRTEIATGGDTNEGGPFRRRRTVLELSRYLELYLWPHFDGATATREHVLSILAMVNQKMRQGFMEVWPLFHSRPEAFDALFQRVIWMVRPPPAGTVDGPPARDGGDGDGGDDDGLSVYEKTIYVRFLISAFQGLEDEAVRAQCLRLVSLPLWKRLGQRRAEKETHALFKEVPHLTKLWAYLTKLAKKKLSDKTRVKKAQMDAQINWLPDLIEAYVADCEAVPLTGDAPRPLVAYCEKFTEFLLDLLSQLPTRRFVNTLISDSALLVRLRASALGRRSDARLFKDLLAMLEASAYFAIDDYTGVALDAEEMERRHVARVTTLQRCAFKHFRSKLERLALAPINALSTPAALVDHLQFLEDGELRDLCVYLRLLDADSVRPYESRDVIIAILVAHHVRRASQLEETKQISLFPSELDLYNGSLLTDLQYRDDMCLALPKLNLQFLTMYDYLLHNFELYRLESTFGIREDIEDVVGRLNPRRDPVDRSLRFKGWARYGLPCRTPAIKFIQRPSLGDTKPAMVRLEVGYSISGVKSPKIKEEWEELRKGDAIFLAAVDPAHALDDRISKHESFSDRTGLRFVRGGEVISLTDKFGNEIDDFTEEGSIKGQERLVQIALDTAQYQRDVDAGEAALYSTLNILIRRNRRSNNFKAVLSSMVDMMGRATHIPDWLHDIFLGYGDPGAAHYTKMAKPGVALHLDWRDTFLDAAHAAEALGRDGATVTFAPTDDGSDPAPPFRCVFEPAGEGADASPPDVTVYSYQTPPRAPFEGANAPKNRVRFTPTQVEAIRSGMSHGLTLVVGPPGTGKTDVAVQIIANLYHSFPEQRIVLATKSNQALNQLFEKLTRLDIAGRHLLRLGHSGKDIRGEDFSRRGRVAYMLEERDLNLTKVTRLSVSLGDGDDAGYTCESAGHYWSTRVQAVWSDFLEAVGDGSATTGEAVAEAFPFTDFFGSTEAVFGDGDGATDGAEALAAAHRAFASLEVLFASLAECHAFELLRTPRDRGRYLITHQSRIIAMTCTYAALKRSELLELGFRYDNIVMEEAAQLMEIETLIPMVLQKDDFVSHNRLKRVIMIGDHRQLSPVVQGVAFQKYGHLDQSMFTRFIRLQVPAIHLDSQGRMRPELASLFNWRYENLGNLPHILERPEFARQNAGFAYPFQFIDVGDLNGVGESAPAAHFIQNLAEAEYTVAVFMYMRLVGYAADKISIITTYNGQKALIRDVLNTRCRDNPLFGLPRDVSTVDKFQGEQNDYILLSMVRTRMVGHVRDVRRLVVAMSRARLGLYVFGRKSLYENCYDIKPTFEHLLARPVQLQLVMNETHPSDRTEARGVGDEGVFAVADLAQMGQIVYQMAGEAARAEQARYELEVKEYEAQKAAAAAKARGQRDDDNAESDDGDDGVGDGGDEDAAAGGSGADVADMDGVTETTG